MPPHGIEAQKIRSLYNAYGAGYDFCRFYRAEGCFISVLDNSAVVCGECLDTEELRDFLLMCGVSDVFGEAALADKLCPPFSRSDVNLMRFCSEISPEISHSSPKLSEAYDILKTAFPIDFEPWYLDMSHRIRHGVSSLAANGASCLCVQYDLNGEVLLSQIATLPEQRSKGYARRLINSVCASLPNREIFVLCEHGLLDFYKKIGFSFVERKAVLIR
ncbi:MAG: GNAT family N-acetyltransferase [Oscillospiraceae bacterium]